VVPRLENTRAPVGRIQHLWHASLLQNWYAAAGVPLSLPMPPFPSHHPWRKLRAGASAWLALFTTAWSNRSIDTDGLSAGFAVLLSAGHLQR